MRNGRVPSRAARPCANDRRGDLPHIAAEAERSSGRRVLVGDFRTVDIPVVPTAIIGNPAFKQAIIQGFLDRSWSLLPEEGRVGFILPCFTFQTASVVERLAQRWAMRQDMIPRNLFPRISMPICFAMFTKSRART